MTKEQRCKAMIEALYRLSHFGVDITFGRDFDGQMTVSLDRKAQGHTHAGTPNGSFEQMVKDVTKFLNDTADEMGLD